MISLKGCHFPKDAVLYAVYFYLRYTVSYRDLEEILTERGVQVDHAALIRWVVRYSPMIAARSQSKKRPTPSSWRMDETYVRVRSNWMYLYRAVDKAADTLDFMLSGGTVQQQPGFLPKRCLQMESRARSSSTKVEPTQRAFEK